MNPYSYHDQDTITTSTYGPLPENVTERANWSQYSAWLMILRKRLL